MIPGTSSLALLTDLYQLTMTCAYWKAGTSENEAVFDLLFHEQPFEGGFSVACGLYQDDDAHVHASCHGFFSKGEEAFPMGEADLATGMAASPMGEAELAMGMAASSMGKAELATGM